MTTETNTMAAKQILCYGDSNTWGTVPGMIGTRMAPHVRWPGVLARVLGPGYRVIEEGLGGRTTVWDDPFTPGIERNGLKTLGTILASHKPLDLVIIFLGTNDLKARNSVTADDVALGVEVLAKAAFSPDFGPGNGQPPAILTVCPCTIWEVPGALGGLFKDGRVTSLDLRGAFRQMTKRTGLPLVYAEDFVHSDPADGIHLSEESHGVLGQEIAKWVSEWFAG